MARLRTELGKIQGITLYMQAAQDITIGGRLSKTQYQYTLADVDTGELNHWAAMFLDKIKTTSRHHRRRHRSAQCRADARHHDQAGCRVRLRHRPRPSTTRSTTHSGSASSRRCSTMLNQYHVVLEVDPKFQYGPEALNGIYASVIQRAAGAALHPGRQVSSKVAPLVVNHQGQFPSVTISYNLAPGTSIGYAVSAIQQVEKELDKPLRCDELPRQCPSLSDLPFEHPHPDCCGARRHLSHPRRAYESLIDPITIISTLPSAGLGARCC